MSDPATITVAHGVNLPNFDSKPGLTRAQDQ
jgi:hypothetical protein